MTNQAIWSKKFFSSRLWILPRNQTCVESRRDTTLRSCFPWLNIQTRYRIAFWQSQRSLKICIGVRTDVREYHPRANKTSPLVSFSILYWPQNWRFLMLTANFQFWYSIHELEEQLDLLQRRMVRFRVTREGHGSKPQTLVYLGGMDQVFVQYHWLFLQIT